MVLQIQKYDLGVEIMTLDKKNDNRGHVVEIFREDWKEFFGKDLIASLASKSLLSAKLLLKPQTLLKKASSL